MKISKGWKTFWMIFIPTAVAGVIVYVAMKGSGGSGQPKTDVNPKNKQPPKQATTPSIFPLKNGSSNDLVKQLQELLGVDNDGKFGPITQAALKSATGKTSIASQADFDSTVQTLQGNLDMQSAGQLANKLNDDYSNDDSLVVFVKNGFTADKYTVDAYDTYISTGVKTNVPSNTQFARDSIRIDGVGGSGLLRVYVTDYSSTLPEGNYLFDPNNITLVNG